MPGVDLPHVIHNSSTLTAGARNRRLHLQGYRYVDFDVTVAALVGAPSVATFDFKLQRKRYRGGSGEWVDIAGKAIVQVTQATSLPFTGLVQLTEADITAFDMRAVITAGAFTGGTAPSWTVSSTYVGRL